MFRVSIATLGVVLFASTCEAQVPVVPIGSFAVAVLDGTTKPNAGLPAISSYGRYNIAGGTTLSKIEIIHEFYDGVLPNSTKVGTDTDILYSATIPNFQNAIAAQYPNSATHFTVFVKVFVNAPDGQGGTRVVPEAFLFPNNGTRFKLADVKPPPAHGGN